ncbi:MAG: hypothetical protein U0353_08290 [Sandaracinus sp.]
MLRRLGVSVFAAASVSFVSGCVVDRSAIEGDLDAASPAELDAYVPPGTDAGLDAARIDAALPPDLDAYTPPDLDAYTPPDLDAYTPPDLDAYTPPDAFVPTPDAFVPTPDAFVPMPDAFVPTPDAFVPMPDAFVPTPDAYTPPPDAYRPPDAYVPPPDAFVAPDSGCNGADDDGDGLRDPCDPWPCGPSTPSIAASVSGEFITISGVSLDAGGNTLVVHGSGMVTVGFSYAIDDTGCPGCRDQIEIGTVPGTRQACPYDANPPGSGASGTTSVGLTVTAGSVPERVDVRFNLSQDYGCAPHMGWWDTTPPAAQTIGAICVVP